MRANFVLTGLLVFAWFAGLSAGAEEPAGATVYREHCARCHDHAAPGSRILPRNALQALSSGTILNALISGVMKQQGAALSPTQRDEVAAWLGATPPTPKASSAKGNSCTPGATVARTGGDWTGWGNRPENWRFQPDPGISLEQIPNLKLKWAYGIAGVSMMRSQPLVYQGRIYVGGDNGTLSSLDAATGCSYWSVTGIAVRSGLSMGRAGGNLGCQIRHDPTCKPDAGPDFDFGSSPILVTLANGKRCLILAQKSGMIYAIDPDHDGDVLWTARAARGGYLGGIQWGPATDGRTVFAAISDLAFLRSPNPGKLNIDPATGGGLVAYAVDSGREEWKVPPASCGDRRPCSPAQSAAVTAIPGAVFSGSLDGHIRAYSASDGKILWDFDTERSFDTVNGVPASGGSLDVAGAVVAQGMVFVVSGYPSYGGKPGNALLAFRVE